MLIITFCLLFLSPPNEYEMEKKEYMILKNGDTAKFSMYFYEESKGDDGKSPFSYEYVLNKRRGYIVDGKFFRYKEYDFVKNINNRKIRSFKNCLNKDSIFKLTKNKDIDYLLIIETK